MFKQQKISSSHTAVESLDTDDTVVASDLTVDNSGISTIQLHDTPVSPESSASADRVADEEDSWNEVDDTKVERAGVFDTSFTSAVFVKDSERADVYGHIDNGRSDCVYSFAPAEGNKPISVFLDKHPEELSFPNISQYSTVVLTVVRVMIAKYSKSGIWGYRSSLTPEPIELK